jgi:integrase/recombinase XerD
MLPEELLLLLRQCWRVRPTRFDTDAPVRERWLFPGRRQGQHLTTRQLSRLFHQSAAAAGITKRVSLHSLRHYSESLIMPSIGSLGTDGRYL